MMFRVTLSTDEPGAADLEPQRLHRAGQKAGNAPFLFTHMMKMQIVNFEGLIAA
jgi:hypothetical protein